MTAPETTLPGRIAPVSGTGNRLWFEHTHQPGVDELAAAGLMAVDGDEVAAGAQAGLGLGAHFDHDVPHGVPFKTRRRDAVQIHLGILIVVDDQLQGFDRESVEYE